MKHHSAFRKNEITLFRGSFQMNEKCICCIHAGAQRAAVSSWILKWKPSESADLRRIRSASLLILRFLSVHSVKAMVVQLKNKCFSYRIKTYANEYTVQQIVISQKSCRESAVGTTLLFHPRNRPIFPAEIAHSAAKPFLSSGLNTG